MLFFFFFLPYLWSHFHAASFVATVLQARGSRPVLCCRVIAQRDLNPLADFNCFSMSKQLKSIEFNIHPSLLAPGWCFRSCFVNSGLYFCSDLLSAADCDWLKGNRTDALKPHQQTSLNRTSALSESNAVDSYTKFSCFLGLTWYILFCVSSALMPPPS